MFVIMGPNAGTQQELTSDLSLSGSKYSARGKSHSHHNKVSADPNTLAQIFRSLSITLAIDTNAYSTDLLFHIS